ncbi:A1S_1983 family putative colistin resistance protein [Acinetobacter larvae]|uniref:Lysozyme inhibitor LprI N-terminal domain-containing protein n=1 Tax=Acinetobacter larvae TaxID=1789224 RepID=A0A1B2LZQ9_9GAMM|nr:hypothetical protein [Acinetobacter larvae]AOA58438.1 hypothetical protein BFG52_08785 [Acinetobacter larvae]
MLLKTDYPSMKKIFSLFFVASLGFATHSTYAASCKLGDQIVQDQPLCIADLDLQRKALNEQLLAASLVSDAPNQLLRDSQSAWLQRVRQCKSLTCRKQQFEQRVDELNFYTSMNQSMTLHYFKFNQGNLSYPAIQLRIHQLNKNRIKIEGFSYQNPNNLPEQQVINLTAYTTPEQKQRIRDNDSGCQYQLQFDKALLQIKSEQKSCNRFVGYYRLYD